MALTSTQKAEVRYYAGWSARFHQFDSQLEQAMLALATEPESELLITQGLTASPPGLIAALKDVDEKLAAAHARLKADEVGTIKLNRAEVQQLRAEGRRFVGRLCSILGVDRGVDVYSSGSAQRDNYVGK